MKNKILVIGGTGTTGRSLIEKLKQNQADFKALVRSEEKAKQFQDQGVETVVGSLGNWESIDPALEGVDTVFLLTGAGPSNVADQNGLIDRAKKAGVNKVVKVSAVVANSGLKVHLAEWHEQIEDHLKNSGLNYVILKPHSFMQNTLMSIPTIKSQNAIYESIGAGKIPMIDTRDVADASYECLTRDAYNNKTYTITGPESIGYDRVAEALSHSTKQQVNYVQIPSEAHNAAMKEAGVPGWLADDLTAMSKFWSESNDQPTNDFKEITGREARSIDEFSKDYASYFQH